jgi:putative membrane-bound dehydrogenase-like protein
MRLPLFLSSLFFCAVVVNSAADTKPGIPPAGPLSPREELASFKIAKSFKVELVACEPEVVDPVAMAFDENGRLFVAEMRGYPNDGVGTGDVKSGRIRMLEDRDGDGFYETSTLYAEGLRLPTGVMPYKGGLIVCNAPDILYLEDTRNSGRADRRSVLYTGFGLANIQQMINGLQWSLDNWVYGGAGANGGTITSPQKPDMAGVTLRGRGVRFHPDALESLEPTTGGGQYGIAPDEWQRWFTSTNSQHLRHIVLPDHYLRRNPLDIPDHGPACQVHRVSPFEAWRVERTTRRADGPDAQRFPKTELVPGGFVTSGCSAVVYAADKFPESHRGNTFVCDPANNLIHRDILVPNGATFIAKRGDDGCEFLASTDTWFRPVFQAIGPDGALYVLDFYREAIETPLSLPDDIKKKMNLESRGRGRIWRIVPDNWNSAEAAKRRKPALGNATAAELVSHLADGNIWWRLTAQRLLIERQDRTAVKALEELARTSKSAVGRAHALWTLDGLKSLDEALILDALKDAEAGVREQALRLADARLKDSSSLRSAIVKLVNDPSPRVRFQLAFTLGEPGEPGASATGDCIRALAQLARRDDNDTWTQTAILSSAHDSAPNLLQTLATDADFTRAASLVRLDMLKRVAGLAGARADDAALAAALGLLGEPGASSTGAKAAEPWQAALLEGLSRGLHDSPRPLAKLWDEPPPALKDAVARARVVFEQASRTSQDDKRPALERAASIQLLGHGPFALLKPIAPDLLRPQEPQEVQLAAVRALGQHLPREVPEILLAAWSGYSPTVRREVLEALVARPERVDSLLRALEQRRVIANQIEPLRIEQLRK